MLFYSGLNSKYVKCLKTLTYFVGKTVDWNPTTKELNLHTRPFKFTILLFTFLFVCQTLHVVTRPKEKTSNVDVIGFAFAVMYVVDSLYAVEMIRNRKVMKTFILSASSFEERYCKNGAGLSLTEKRKLKSAKRLCSILAWVGLGRIGFALGIIAVLLPDTLMNVLSYPPGSWVVSTLEYRLDLFLPKALAWTIPKLFVFLVNFYVYTIGYGWAVTLAIQILVGSTFLTVEISIFRRCLEKIHNQQYS